MGHFQLKAIPTILFMIVMVSCVGEGSDGEDAGAGDASADGDTDADGGADGGEDLCLNVDCAADNDVCNGKEVCNPKDGKCVSENPLVCDDGKACNGVETCVAATGCTDPADVSCVPNSTCTEPDGVCVCDPGYIGGKCDIQVVQIPAGSFWMGSPDGDCPDGYPGGTSTCDDELGRATGEELHEVTLTRKFEMMRYEVTQADFEALIGWNPAEWSDAGTNTDCGLDCPVENVSWYDTLAYANLLSAETGLSPCYAFADVICEAGAAPIDQTDYMACFDGSEATSGGIDSATVTLTGGASTPYDCTGYRLPTEAEWEYAIRAGSWSAFYPINNGSGNITQTACDDPLLNQIGWYCKTPQTTHPVGGKEPNMWGLYDMSGNVYEWVWDDFASLTVDPATDPTGPTGRPNKVLRGGAYYSNAHDCRCANRFDLPPGSRASSEGFRLVRSK